MHSAIECFKSFLCVQVEYIEDVGLITSSLDSRIYIFDVNRDGIMHEVKHHRKGVQDFAYCRPYSLFGSCGERSIMLWQAQNGRLISELLGHSAPVSAVAMDDEYAPVTRWLCLRTMSGIVMLRVCVGGGDRASHHHCTTY